MKRRICSLLLYLQIAGLSALPQAPKPPFLTGDKLAQYKLSKATLKAGAEKNDPRSQYALGLLYEFPPDGTPPNRAGAAYWFQQASDQGDMRSAFRLGLYYYDLGDDDMAFKFFEKSANGGFTPAMYRLGEMMIRRNLGGYGEVQGFPWVDKASKAGDPDAENYLGIRDWEKYFRPGGDIYWANESRNWFTRAAIGGSCEAMFNLGSIYFDGLGVTQDPARADMAYARAQACPGAPSWVLEKSALYRKRIAMHQLPDPALSRPAPEPPPTRVDSHEGKGMTLIALFAGVAGAVALVAHNDPNPGTVTEDPWQKINDDYLNKVNDAYAGDAWCKVGHTYEAASLGVIC